VAAYARHAPLRREWLVASVSGLAGYFCVEAAQPPVSAVPHVRAAQRRQLRSCLSWLSRALALPPPTWLDAVLE
jgi:hypothetical protein